MKNLKVYHTPEEYLNDIELFLLENELANNLILGLCYNIADKTKHYSTCNFIAVFNGNTVIATVINTLPRVIIYNPNQDIEALQLISDYYKTINFNLDCVFSDPFSAEAFTKIYNKTIKQKIALNFS